MSSTKFEEAVEVMKRIEATKGTKDGKMLVKGTIVVEGEEIVHSSFDNTTTASISRSLFPFSDIYSSCIRTIDPTDKVEFIKINFSKGDNHDIEVLMAPDCEFQGIVVQEHPIRNLTKRPPKDQKNPRGYRHFPLDIYPSPDDLQTPPPQK